MQAKSRDMAIISEQRPLLSAPLHRMSLQQHRVSWFNSLQPFGLHVQFSLLRSRAQLLFTSGAMKLKKASSSSSSSSSSHLTAANIKHAYFCACTVLIYCMFCVKRLYSVTCNSSNPGYQDLTAFSKQLKNLLHGTLFFVCLFVCSFVRSFVCSFVCLLICSFASILTGSWVLCADTLSAEFLVCFTFNKIFVLVGCEGISALFVFGGVAYNTT